MSHWPRILFPRAKCVGTYTKFSLEEKDIQIKGETQYSST